MTTYVSSDYIQQVARIRQHLNHYRGSFLSLNYISGDRIPIDSAYNIWANLCLITSKVRPAFLVQWIDYMDPSIYQRTMELLVKYRDTLDDRDIDYRLLFLTDPQGIIVTTYYTYYKQNLRNIYAKYITSYHDNINLVKGAKLLPPEDSGSLLGIILGYPAIGGLEFHKEDLEFLNKNQQPLSTSGCQVESSILPNRYIFSIFIVTFGSGVRQILANIYRSQNSRIKLYELYKKISDTMKIYDPESIVIIEDTQGSLISPNETLQPNDFIRIDVSKEDIILHQAFIDSPDRKEENWNNEFDRIFELGYLYH